MRNQRTRTKETEGVPKQAIPAINQSLRTQDYDNRKPKDYLHGNRIKSILAEIGMSQEELADRALDGNAPFLTRIVTGQKKQPSLTTAFRIAKVLGRPIEEIFIYRPTGE